MIAHSELAAVTVAAAALAYWQHCHPGMEGAPFSIHAVLRCSEPYLNVLWGLAGGAVYLHYD
jgi:hypothetical protein